ncbi:MAG TPA: sugar-binding transcriptional regulator [Bryobacteraceae bacterium]|nr:sugar-binding transcriptional regulator [Bryobacteraceae bacterium]
MARVDELRLMTKVARMYHEQGLRQTEIMDRLNMSQSTISRLLKRAEKAGIVRITVSVPSGTHPDLEEALQEIYGLKEAIVVDSMEDDDQIVRDLGPAAAYYIETTLKSSDVVGLSSWSAALLAMVDSMQPSQRSGGVRVVQILGGVGNPSAEAHATHLTRRFADLVGGSATLLPAPGVVGSAEARRVLMRDRFVQEAVQLIGTVTLALVGIGAVEPSRMLAESGNVFSSGELQTLRNHGAVGDICLRFFGKNGAPVVTPLNDRVIGMDLGQLRRVSRIVGVAGGLRKTAAIRGALAGRLVNVLITDRNTAQRLLNGNGGSESNGRAHRRRGAAGRSTEGALPR